MVMFSGDTTRHTREGALLAVLDMWMLASLPRVLVITEQVRLSFIYLSFVTAGLHLVPYLIMAFILQHKERIKQPFRKRSTVWEL